MVKVQRLFLLLLLQVQRRLRSLLLQRGGRGHPGRRVLLRQWQGTGREVVVTGSWMSSSRIVAPAGVSVVLLLLLLLGRHVMWRVPKRRRRVVVMQMVVVRMVVGEVVRGRRGRRRRDRGGGRRVVMVEEGEAGFERGGRRMEGRGRRVGRGFGLKELG